MDKLRSFQLQTLIIGFAIVALASGGSAGQKVTTSTENGITVVHNPKEPVPQRGGPSRLILKEELALGEEAGAEGPLFADLRSIGVDDQENIWTLDWTDIKVRVFDKTGKLISTFGQKGQGPKELQNPHRMVVSGDGKAYVLDANKLAVYNLKGECLRELSTAKTQPVRIKLNPAADIFLDNWIGAPGGFQFNLIKYDANLNPLFKVQTWFEPIAPGERKLFIPIAFFVPTRDGRVIYGVGQEYRLHILDKNGKPSGMIIKDYAPKKISAAEREALIKDRLGTQAGQVKVDSPDTFPPFQSFIGDDQDRLFVKTYEKDGQGNYWHDVFDAQGRCFTRFALPEDEMLFVVKKNRMYVIISENEEGIPLVKRYGMEWR